MATHRFLITGCCTVITFIAALAVIAGVGCATGDLALEAPPTVILISMDGTRPADVDAESVPSLVALAARGVSAERLLPATPSNTFPSHVTLVTGVEPERHGIVNNSFRDVALGLFRKDETHLFMQKEPVWSYLAERGVVSAAYHWPGSEGAWPGGHAPQHWVPFAEKASEVEKVERILEWLALPASEGRPQLITTWFRGADAAGHRFGPGSAEVGLLLASQESALELLIEALETRALFETTTLIVVSDHGMASAARHVDLRTALRDAGVEAEMFGAGGSSIIRLAEGAQGDPAAAAQIIEVARSLGLEAVRRSDAPASMRYANERFGDVIVRARVGTAIVYADRSIVGYHGYDAAAPEMGGIFIAAGRGVEPGSKLPPIRAVDVAPTVLRLLGLQKAAWMDGEAISAIRP